MPVGLLSEFHEQVARFLKGGHADVDLNALRVGIEEGSYKINVPMMALVNKRPPNPAQQLVKKLARLVPGDKQLRTLLDNLNEVLQVIRTDFDTETLTVSDPARVIRERKK